MTVWSSKTEKDLLRNIEDAEEEVREWEGRRFWLVFAQTVSWTTLVVGIVLGVLGLLPGDYPAYLIVPGAFLGPVSTAVYFWVRHNAWSEHNGRAYPFDGRIRTVGPYRTLREHRRRYEDFLDQQASER